jgi:hypothetical protein
MADEYYVEVTLWGYKYNGPGKVFLRTFLTETLGNALIRVITDESTRVSKLEAAKHSDGEKTTMDTSTPVAALKAFGYKYVYVELTTGVFSF